MRVLLIDDEELALDVLEILLNKIGGIEIVGKFQAPEFALQELENSEVDVIFLDMDMGEVHGIEFAERIIEQYSHIEILFVTAYPQFALEAFEVNAIDYLLKPVNLSRLKKAIVKVQEKLVLYKARKKSTILDEQSLFVYSMKSFRLINSQKNVIKWRTRKVKELFVFLWHYRENPIHKARIIEELWPEMDISKSVGLLHTTIYRLRKTLKENGLDNAINLVNDCYILSVPPASDLDELENLLRSEEFSQADIRRLLEVYSGDYLEDEDYTWAIEKQQSIKQSVLNELERFIAASKNKEEHTLLVEESLEKMLKIDMYNEKYMLQLLTHYGQTNNVSKMNAFFQIIRERLEDELGIEVPADIKEVYKRYLKAEEKTNTMR